MQESLINLKEKNVKQKIKSACFTHAGGIVFRRMKQQPSQDNSSIIEYLITTNKAENQAKNGKKYLFPKGHIEKNEEISQAAIREVYEETGALAHVIRPAGTFHESEPGHNVKLYLMEFLYQGRSKEEREMYWLPFEKAHDQLSFPESKGIIIHMHTFLLSNTSVTNLDK